MAKELQNDSGLIQGMDRSITIRQVADLLAELGGRPSLLPAGATSFALAIHPADARAGILQAQADLADDGTILLAAELVRSADNVRVSAPAFFTHLADLGSRARLAPPRKTKTGENALWVELLIDPAPLTLARSAALLSQLRKLDELARALQAEMPDVADAPDNAQVYGDLGGVVQAVRVIPESGVPELADWSGEVADYLASGASVAFSARSSVEEALGASAVARALRRLGMPLGKIVAPAVNAQALVDLCRKAPGRLTLSALQVGIATSPYDLGREIAALLNALSSLGQAALFSGTLTQLQSVFHGGQGGAVDPLQPVISHMPQLDLKTVTQGALRLASERAGGLSASLFDALTIETLGELRGRDLTEAAGVKLAPLLVRRKLATVGMSGGQAATARLLVASSRARETLAGLSPRPRARRLDEVQDLYTRRLTDPALIEDLSRSLFGQDRALAELAARLRTEALTRPFSQPLRYCVQGTPGTGKSESALLLAERLDIPLVVIDVASFSDYHTANSQLLGSGRGIVGSFQAGRLEQVAKHHTGVLVEVSDLDHAPGSVRSFVADLFLQVLETGEIQTAMGATVSCANVIFAFSLNLPGKLDESLRRGLGFQGAPDARELRDRVTAELKSLFSSAFLSRVGVPILFDPLSPDACARVLERAVLSAVRSAAERLHLAFAEVTAAPLLGERLLATMPESASAFGARVILERGRRLAAQAFLNWSAASGASEGATALEITADESGDLKIYAKG